ncbi:MAG: FAD-dependent oxidoreductase [Elusimicrobia bacterium]|nr:FAD-dependent oxidoreductase [Elusimicrobiota bacterium]
MASIRGLLAAGAWALCAPLAAAEPFPVTVRGGGESSFRSALPKGPAARDSERYDAVIVGGGPAGLTAAVYLTDAGKKVLLLEKEPVFGGLAASGTTADGIPFDRGVAYWTSAYEEEAKILERIGLGAYKDKYPIPEPIDSYLWNGRLYEGLWEDATLRELPASFALFRSELKRADAAKLIPNQPFEEGQNLELDAMTAADWIGRMPAAAADREDPAGKEVYERFLKDPALDRAAPMKDVLGLLDLFSRSALGAVTTEVSAAAFANFYISEIETRYTTPIGTGEATALMEGLLRRRGHLAKLKAGAAVRAIEESPEGVRVRYVEGGKAREAEGAYAVFAAQLKFAPAIIRGLSERDPERAAAIAALEYSHYSVHVLFVKGHPYRASYDTWTRAADARPTDFTDVVVGRWADPAIQGYRGLRDFKKDPADDRGILTVYQPYRHREPGHSAAPGVEDAHVEGVARAAAARLKELYDPLLKARWGTSIEVRAAETSRWPFSVHVARPGHFSKLSKVLRRPFGKVFFANNNIGTPAFEEALFRGHCAANNILKRMDAGFSQEGWSRCPLEGIAP